MWHALEYKWLSNNQTYYIYAESDISLNEYHTQCPRQVAVNARASLENMLDPSKETCIDYWIAETLVDLIDIFRANGNSKVSLSYPCGATGVPVKLFLKQLLNSPATTQQPSVGLAVINPRGIENLKKTSQETSSGEICPKCGEFFPMSENSFAGKNMCYSCLVWS